MPKVSKSAKAAKAASRGPVFKSVRFTLDGYQASTDIYGSSSPNDIYRAFLGSLPPLDCDIKIVDDKGTKLSLSYNQVKNNGCVHAQSRGCKALIALDLDPRRSRSCSRKSAQTGAS
jgi:hypothetical protein